jgi:hypothetical protein
VVRRDAAEHVRGTVEPLQHEALVEVELLHFRLRRNIVGICHFQDAPGLASFGSATLARGSCIEASKQ